MLDSPSAGPPMKKIKLTEEDSAQPSEECEEDSENNCSICLQYMEDRTVIPTCSHEFCFDCLMIWAAQSRRCPLCTQNIGEYVIHDIRSRFDYRKHHLAPLRSNSPQLLLPPRTTAAIEARNAARRRRRDRERERRRHEELDERDKLELSIATRRWIYKHDLYAKHVASNSFTKYRPYPTPAQFAASPDLISRTTTFLRRELQIWQGLDVEFLTNLIISLMKAIDIRSESAVKLLAEFLDMDILYESGNRHVNAEHFAHEVYSYVRSPYRDLFVYDSVVQYDRPRDVSPPPQARRQRTRWYTESPERHTPQNQRSQSPSASSRQTEHDGPPLREGDRRAWHQHYTSSSLSPDLECTESIDKQEKAEIPMSRVTRTPRKDYRSLRCDLYDKIGDGKDTSPTGISRKGKERENEMVSVDTGQHLPYLDSNHHASDILLAKNPASISPETPGGLDSLTSHFSHLHGSKGKQKAEEREPTPPFHSLAQDATRASHSAHDRKLENEFRTKKTRRPQTLLESVRAHLKPGASTTRSTQWENNTPPLHTSSRTSSHYQNPHQHVPSSRRLSNPVTNLADERTGKWGATDSHQSGDKHLGNSALGRISKIDPPVTSNVYAIKDEANSNNCGPQSSTSSALGSVSNELADSAQQRPSSPNDGHQDNSGLTTDVVRNLTTMRLPPSEGSELMLPDASFSQSHHEAPTNPTALFSIGAQTQASERSHINNVQDGREAYQIDETHVGSIPRPIHTHGPPSPAPIMERQSDRESLRSDLSSKLLSRLHEETKQAREAWGSQNASIGVKEARGRQSPSVGFPLNAEGQVPTSATDSSSPKNGMGRSMRDCRDPDGENPDPNTISIITGVDTTALEVRLRARMRLRARLAAEKRVGETR